jgi:CheY-like chemotaxis protein
MNGPSIVVFDSSWQQTHHTSSHQSLLEELLAVQTQVPILGFSLFETDQAKTRTWPVTPAHKIIVNNPAVMILDLMVAPHGHPMDYKRGTELFIWIRQQDALRHIPIIVITDVDVPETDKVAFRQYGVVEFFHWHNLCQFVMPLKTLVTRTLIAHEHKTTP